MKAVGLILAIGLAATSAQAASNVLNWTDNATNETSQNVERGTAASVAQCPTATYAPIASVPANVTTYTDVAVVEGLVYCYRLNAQNGAGVSPYSPSVGRLIPPTVPPAQSGLSVTGGP